MNENRIESAQQARICPLKELPPGERPRERLFAMGAERLTDAELLGLIFGAGVRGATAVDLGRRLVSRYGGLRGLARPAAVELAGETGIGSARAARLVAALELGRRFAASPLERRVRIEGSETVRRHFGPLLADLPRERIYAILLDARNCVIRAHLVVEGTLGEAAVHPREVFVAALRESASAVVIVHNHPSGDPSPSEADYAITARLVLAGRILGIRVLDHVIVAGTDAVSLAALHGGRLDSLSAEHPLTEAVSEIPVVYVAGSPSQETAPALPGGHGS